MYLQHFGLISYPFSITPDAGVIYYNEQYRDAYAHLHYSVQHPGGIIVLTGEVGTGKTTLIRSFLSRQDASQVQTAYIFNPKQSVASLLANICQELGVKTGRSSSSKKLIDLLYEHFIDAFKNRQRALIVIDEAQHLDFDSLEYLRLITNLEVGVNKLVQIVLVGQEELLVKLSRNELRQFNQRIVARFHLRRLNERQLFDYVQHRLSMANGSPSIIPKSLSRLLYHYTKGTPRLANILCDRALIGAYAKNRSRVDKKILKKAAAELFIETTAAQSQNINTAVTDNLEAKQQTMEKPWGSQTPTATASTAQAILSLLDFNRLKHTFAHSFQRIAIVSLAVIAGGWLWTDHDSQLLVTGEEAQGKAADTPEKEPLPNYFEQELIIPPAYTQPNLENKNKPSYPGRELIAPTYTGPNSEIVKNTDIKTKIEKEVDLSFTEPDIKRPEITVYFNDLSDQVVEQESAEDSATISPFLVDAVTIDNLEQIPKLSRPYQDYSSLLDLWGVNYTFSSKESPCLSVQEYQLTCAHIKADVDLIRKINLPTIIEWQTQESEKRNQTALLVGFDDSEAILFREDKYFRINNKNLAKSWKGYGHYFIRAPKDFRSAFKPESTSDSIIWLINALTEIDEKYSLQEVSKTYNTQIVQTVKTFQKQQGLPADGIVGFETLAKLNHLLYQAPQLEQIK